MRALARNKKTFYYCLYKTKAPIYDSNNYETGDYLITYENPVQLKANISASKGDSVPELFGTNISYDRVIIVDDINCPIDENTVLFVDKEPEFDILNNISVPKYDYIVIKKAPSINFIAYAISKVK